MTRRPRRNTAPAFKAKVALAAIKGEKTLAELAQQLMCTRTRSRTGRRSCWRVRRGIWVRVSRTRGSASGGCEDAARQDRRAGAGERFFVRRARQGRPAERKAMIDRSHDLPLTRQAEAAGAQPRQRLLRAPAGPAADLAMMRRIDELHLDYPFAGSRMLRDLLRGEGFAIGREHVATMMRRMGIEALYRRPNTSKPATGTRSIRICCAAWRSIGRTRCGRWTSPTFRWRAASSTWPPWSTGSAAGSWRGGCRSRWRSSSASRRSRRRSPGTADPEIFNTDQGSQFTSAAFTGLLLENAIAISMDGKRCWRDNVFVERLWRSIKYEEVYLHAYDSVGQARASLGRYLDFYNRKRPHSRLAARTPDRAYFDHLPLVAAA